MANIVSEILNINHNTQQNQFRDLLVEVDGKIAGLKTELVEATEAVFVLLDADIKRVTSWSVELSGVQQQLQDMSSRYERDKKALENSSDEIDFTSEELEQCEKTIDTLQKLVEVVRNIEVSIPEADVHQAARTLKRAEDILEEISENFQSPEDINWTASISSCIETKFRATQKQALKQWNLFFKFETNGLVINQTSCNMSELVETLEHTQLFSRVMTKFCDQVWQEILSKICSLDYKVQTTKSNMGNFMSSTAIRPNNKTTMLDKTKYYDCDYFPNREHEEDLDLTLRLDETNCAGDVPPRQFSVCSMKCKRVETPLHEAKVVFRFITEVLTIFRDVFLDKWTVMEHMGINISPKLCEALSTKCLKNLILKNANGNKEKAKIDLQAMQDFVFTLSNELNFLIDTKVFEDLSENFEGSFISQIREDLIVQIRNLIKSDVVVHTVEFIPEGTSNDASGGLDEIAVLHKNPFLFPKCTISKSIRDMVDLLKAHLSKFPNDLNMTDSAYNSYLALVTVPKSESEAGDLVPLTAVLVHNNSLYLTHHASVSFKMCEDKILLLRNKASQAYSFMMRSIRTKLNGMISEAMTGLDERVKTSDDDVCNKFLVIAVEFARLDDVFKVVMPKRVWQKTLATLVDHTVNEMCSKVLSWDDISATTANELAESFTRFSVATSELFKGDAKSLREVDVMVSKVVSKWQRFRLLTFVVTASMKEIEDKWVDGCGPLGLAFTGEEVRKLVRALFQNTDHRAAFLASIK